MQLEGIILTIEFKYFHYVLYVSFPPNLEFIFLDILFIHFKCRKCNIQLKKKHARLFRMLLIYFANAYIL